MRSRMVKTIGFRIRLWGAPKFISQGKAKKLAKKTKKEWSVQKEDSLKS